MSKTSEYLAHAVSKLEERAQADGLIVDSSATHAMEIALGNALATAEQSEGMQGFSERRAEFDRTAIRLADEVANEAHKHRVRIVGSGHVESAAGRLRAWNFWPFKGS